MYVLVIILQMPILALVRSCKMENVKFIKVAGIDGIETEHAIIDRGNGEFTSMLKSTYDTLASELSNPSTPQAGE